MNAASRWITVVAILVLAATSALAARAGTPTAVATAEPSADETGRGHSSALPIHQAADPEAPVVTAETLFSSERFWPYNVSLCDSWQPPGRSTPLRAGTRGVLIRLESPSRARIDFGRNGLHEVPVAKTDLVEAANRIRTGAERKMAPNFVLAVAPRLLDAGADSARAFRVSEAVRWQAFVAVFADPDSQDFADIAAAVAPLRERDGVLVILFPQTEQHDRRVWERLRAVGWRAPFVYGHLSEPYTQTLLSDATPQPAISLQTAEGRLLFESSWRPDVVSELIAALDQFPSGDLTAAMTSADAPESAGPQASPGAGTEP